MEVIAQNDNTTAEFGDCFTQLYYNNCDICKNDCVTSASSSNGGLVALVIIETALLCLLLCVAILSHLIVKRRRVFRPTHEDV